MILLWIGVGGGIGAVLRYLIHLKVDQLHSFAFPIGILGINVLGSFLMGFLAYLFATHIQLPDAQRLGIMVGLLGGFTTFSTFSNDTIQLMLRGELLIAVLNVVLSVVLCIMAAGLGLYAAKSF